MDVSDQLGPVLEAAERNYQHRIVQMLKWIEDGVTEDEKEHKVRFHRTRFALDKAREIVAATAD